MGVGAHDVLGRVAASVGELESVMPEFQPVLDVPWAAFYLHYQCY
jgi:hypothetical protein